MEIPECLPHRQGAELPANSIAIIGMAGRFPGAKNVDEFWQNLRNGVESIRHFSDEQLRQAGVPDSLLRNPRYVKAGVVLEDIDKFDAGFFGYTPREVELMDPQQRLLLECAWEALEHSGYDAARFDGPVGVFAGASLNSYLLRHVFASGRLDAAGLQAILGNSADFLATRLSYKLDLKGPSVTVQSSCSTSLVAVHLACQSLLNGECDMALAGGASISLPQGVGYLYQEQGIYSPDGHCRAFDVQANGTAGGRGAAIVVLKRLEDAVADGDTIYAVIRGSAVNNDGAEKIGFTAPSVTGQAQVIAEALAVADVKPETIGYIETHGTGTPLGDPIEIEALQQVFSSEGADNGVRPHRGALLQAERSESSSANSRTHRQFCALGALKTNIGHLDAAAGVAGLIKTALILYHGEIPPTLNHTAPNPKIDFANSPFFLNTELRPWPHRETPRRAGVSSFGMGGTNAHVILEEAPQLGKSSCQPADRHHPIRSGPQPCASARPFQLLLLSAKTETALVAQAQRLAAHLQSHPEQELADVAYTLQVGRAAFRHRGAVVCADREAAIAALAQPDSGALLRGQADEPTPAVAFMFSGQGAQYVDMGRGLYESEPVFREHVDRCCELLLPYAGFDLRKVLYPELFGAKHGDDGIRSDPVSGSVSPSEEKPGQKTMRDPSRGDESESSPLSRYAEKLKQTAITQPALFVIEYAIAQLLISWGVKPQAMIGHSIGEYVAACLAGVFSPEDALRLVSKRGQLMQSLPPGAMLAVPLAAEEVESLLDGRLDIAAINEPERCVVSGSLEAIAAFEKSLAEKGISSRRLQTSHAFHSAMMDEILDAFTAEVGKVTLHPPQLPYISNVTGTWITAEEATDPGYYARHLRQAVRFAEGVKQLLAEPSRVLLEVGPGRTLATLAKRQAAQEKGHVVLSSLQHPQVSMSDDAFVLQTLGRLWLAGVKIDWRGFYARRLTGRRVPLPTYPFERRRYWIEPGEVSSPSAGRRGRLHKIPNLADWFYAPSWKRLPAEPVRPAIGGSEHLKPAQAESTRLAGRWLIFADQGGAGEAIAGLLAQAGCKVVVVRPGKQFARRNVRQLTDGSDLSADGTRSGTGARPDAFAAAYELDPKSGREAYDALVADLRAQRQIPDHVLHAWSVDLLRSGAPDPEKVKNHGFFSLLYLTQAFGSWNDRHPLQLVVLTQNAFDVLGTETPVPEQALLVGLCKVIPQENPNYRCRVIDLDPVGRQERAADGSAAQVIAELAASGSGAVVALRGCYRWVPVYEPQPLPPPSGGAQGSAPLPGPPTRQKTNVPVLRERGVYLITGGTGGIGLEVARFLAEQANARLILTGRAALPAPEMREKWLATHDAEDLTSRKLSRLQQLEEIGGEVLYCRADVADAVAMRAAVIEGEKRFGRLRGVVHAAGAGKDAVILRMLTREDCERQFRPKLAGLRVLEQVLGERELDFCVVLSSLSAVLGALGFAAYTAAHCALDVFVQLHNRSSSQKWTVVNWDNWLSWKEPEALLQGEEAELWMSPAEGVDAFARVLVHSLGQHLIVSTGDLSARLARWQQPRKAAAFPPAGGQEHVSNDGPTASPKRHPRPALQTAYAEPEGKVETTLAGIWAELLGIERVGRHDNFFELGGDSVLMIQIISRANEAGIRLTANQIFEHPTVAELAGVAGMTNVRRVEQGLVTGDVPQTPIQHWFFEQNFAEPHHFNLPLLLDVRNGIAPESIETALRALVRHHDALRLRFRSKRGKVTQSHGSVESSLTFEHIDLSNLPEAEQKRELALRASALQASLDPVNGPLFRAAYFTCGSRHLAQLLLVVHHLVIDVVSWRIMLEDLQTALRQTLRGREVQLPAKTTSYRQWAEQLQAYARDAKIAAQKAYWLGLPWQEVEKLPVDFPNGKNLQGSARSIKVALNPKLTQTLLREVPQVYKSQIHEVLLTALASVVADWTGYQVQLYHFEAHGREDIFEGVDLSRTVGWFTNLFPIVLRLEDATEPGALLRTVKEQVRAIPAKGIGYGLLRYLSDDASIRRHLHALPQPEVGFLYMGQFDQSAPVDALLKVSADVAGAPCSPANARQHLLDVFGLVRDGELQIEWMYSSELYRRETVERLANRYIEKLTEMIEQGRRPQAGRSALTPADFPAARVNAQDLAKLLKKVGRTK